jgi:hypothetical protein
MKYSVGPNFHPYGTLQPSFLSSETPAFRPSGTAVSSLQSSRSSHNSLETVNSLPALCQPITDLPSVLSSAASIFHPSGRTSASIQSSGALQITLEAENSLPTLPLPEATFGASVFHPPGRSQPSVHLTDSVPNFLPSGKPQSSIQSTFPNLHPAGTFQSSVQPLPACTTLMHLMQRIPGVISRGTWSNIIRYGDHIHFGSSHHVLILHCSSKLSNILFPYSFHKSALE